MEDYWLAKENKTEGLDLVPTEVTMLDIQVLSNCLPITIDESCHNKFGMKI